MDADSWCRDLVGVVRHIEYPLSHESSVPMAADRRAGARRRGQGAPERRGGGRAVRRLHLGRPAFGPAVSAARAAAAACGVGARALRREWRVARGAGGLAPGGDSEAVAAFEARLGEDALAAYGHSASHVAPRGFEKVAQRLRPAFQTALLGWIKGGDVGRHLDEPLRVSLGLERAAATEQVQQLWSVLIAVLTAIRAAGSRRR